MSTNSTIAIRTGDTWKGRYVHWDGDSVGEDVKTLIARDGVEKVIETLVTGDHYGWSNINPDQQDSLPVGYGDGRFVAVPGYGIAYTTEQGQSSPDQWVNTVGGHIEYAHIIEADGTVTTIEG